jgi:NitT/TauT family transport system substrate-binding protein
MGIGAWGGAIASQLGHLNTYRGRSRPATPISFSISFMLTRRSFLYSGLAAGSLLTTLSSCTPKPTTPLRVGMIDWTGYEPFYLAKSLGFYDNSTIELVGFTDIAGVFRAYREQRITCCAGTIAEILQVAGTLPNQQVIFVIDQSAGADAIVAKPRITQLADLKGQRIGTDMMPLSSQMLTSALEKANLKLSDVKLVNFGMADQLEAYKADRVDAVITFDPFRTQLVKAGAKTIFDSTQIPNQIVDVMLTSQANLSQHGPALKILTAGFFKAVDYLQQNPVDAIARMAARQKITPDEFAASLKLIKLIDRGTNQTMLDPTQTPLIKVTDQLNQFMVTQKLIPQAVNFKSLLTTAALPSA